jgi:hypothetical protein
MSRYSMLTIPPLKNLQQGYCSVTATEGPRNAGAADLKRSALICGWLD